MKVNEKCEKYVKSQENKTRGRDKSMKRGIDETKNRRNEESRKPRKRGNENGLVKCLQPDAEDLEKRVKGIGADKSIHSSNWWEQAFNTAAVSIVGKKSKSKSSSKKRKAEKEAKKKEGQKIKSKPKVGGGRHGRRS